MTPLFCGSRRVSAARVQRKVPVRVMSSTVDHCSSVISTSGTVPPSPALCTATSMRPNRATRAVVERAHLRLVAHVAGQRVHPVRVARLRARQLLGGLGQAPLVGVGDHDRRALLEAAPGGGGADAGPGRRGHDDDLAVEQPVAARRRRRWRRVEGRIEACAHATPFGSGGRPSTRSPMMLRWISFDPP